MSFSVVGRFQTFEQIKDDYSFSDTDPETYLFEPELTEEELLELETGRAERGSNGSSVSWGRCDTGERKQEASGATEVRLRCTEWEKREFI